MSLTLSRALRLDPAACVAFIGAGGKTTAMFQLARQLSAPLIITATSHMGVWQLGWADRHIVANTPGPIERLEHGLNGVILVTGEVEGDRTKPVNSDLLDWLRQFCGYHAIPLLIEADGSRGKPLKAWAEHEPPIPEFAEYVVHVAGLSGLGRSLNDENIYRPERFSGLSGLAHDEAVTPESLVRVLSHPEGGLKNIPRSAHKIVLLNQADSHQLQATGQSLAQPLLAVYDAVIVASLEQKTIFAVHEPVAGIVLAAGESSRFGQPKQLLDWKGQPFVRAVAEKALQAGLSPVQVVTGANGEAIARTVSDLQVDVINNQDWKSGQSSSIKAGLQGLKSVGGAIFLLVDQPQVTTSILRALVEKHAEGLFPIVAPMVMDRRANPVLFDRATFPDLLLLEGDVGGRAVFHKHRVEYLPWHDDRLLLDVDTPEMYQRLISDETL